MNHINNLLYDVDANIKDSFGHRLHLLRPYYTRFGFGVTSSYASLQLNGANNNNAIAVGMPYVNGVTFMENLLARKFWWTIQFDRNKYIVQDSCTTEIICLNTGEKWNFTKEEYDKKTKVYQNNTDDDVLYSFANQIIIYDRTIEPKAGYVYQITIKGLKNPKTGLATDYTYRAVFANADSNNDIAKINSINIEKDIDLEKISDTVYSGKVGKTYKLNAIIDKPDSENVDKKLTWESSNPNLISVKQDGTITILKEDNNKSAVIKVYADANTNVQAEITIKPQSVSLICDNDEIKNMTYTFDSLNQTMKLSAHLSNGESTTFTYKSSNEKVLKVSKNGVVTPVAPGFAYATITDNKYNKLLSCECFVRLPITLSDGSKAYLGDMDRNGVYNSADSSIILDAYKNGASADQLLIGDLTGDGFLNANDSSKAIDLFVKGTFSPGKYYTITSIRLNKEELTLNPGNSETLIATIEPKNTTDSPNLTWISSDESIAKVDENGKITAISEGIAEITAKSKNGKEDTCLVTVDNNSETTTYLKGDVNGDGKVNGKDWIRLYEHISETNKLTGEELKRADVNDDGKVNGKDWIRLYEHINETNPLF